MPTAMQATALLAPRATMAAVMPESLFALLQGLMDQEQWDPTTRTTTLATLVAYHAATAAPDKYTQVVAIQKIRKDALLLLDHMWNMFGSGNYGIYGMPIDAPSAPQLTEVLQTVAATRTTKTLPPLPGPKR